MRFLKKKKKKRKTDFTLCNHKLSLEKQTPGNIIASLDSATDYRTTRIQLESKEVTSRDNNLSILGRLRLLPSCVVFEAKMQPTRDVEALNLSTWRYRWRDVTNDKTAYFSYFLSQKLYAAGEKTGIIILRHVATDTFLQNHTNPAAKINYYVNRCGRFVAWSVSHACRLKEGTGRGIMEILGNFGLRGLPQFTKNNRICIMTWTTKAMRHEREHAGLYRLYCSSVFVMHRIHRMKHD